MDAKAPDVSYTVCRAAAVLILKNASLSDDPTDIEYDVLAGKLQETAQEYLSELEEVES